MKKKNIIALLLLVSIFSSGCRVRLKEGYTITGGDSQLVDKTKSLGFINLASSFVDEVRIKANEGTKLGFFSTDIMYLVPVGNENESCVNLKYNTASPFSDEWNYAFVAVSFTGSGYKYYFIGEDATGHGLELTLSSELDSIADEKIYSSYDSTNIDKNISDNLKELYNIGSNAVYNDVRNTWMWNTLIDETNPKNGVVVISKSAGCRY